MSPIRIGMLTPSSNTVLEPMTTRILRSMPETSVHFSRFRVTAIGLDDTLLGQFDDRPMMAAAELLADAKVEVISWNGTSAGWLGLDADRRLCERITDATGIIASTSVLSLFEIMQLRGERRIGLVTPYTSDVQQAIVTTFANEGIQVIDERHLGIRDNFSFSEVGRDAIAGMVTEVAEARPDAIAIFCTNLAGADLVAGLETRHDIAIHDSIATSVYGAVKAIGQPTDRISNYGRLFKQTTNSFQP